MRFSTCTVASILICFWTQVWAADLPKPLTDDDFRSYPEEQVRLGQLLFYDRLLSGTYRVACATCHNHDRASTNGARLDGKEEERDELAVNGEAVYEPFKPSSKHAPPLFNLGAKQFTRMFADSRIERLSDGSFRSPAENKLPVGLRDVLAVQALFPAVQSDELVGTVENDLAAVAHKGNQAIWDALAARVRDTEGYWPHFQNAFPEMENPKSISIVHIANAIGAFVGTEWRSDDAPFDRFLRGDRNVLNTQQKQGMRLFYGEAGCSACHSNALQTDHQTYPVAQEKRRTPSLRNISATAPYGGDGKVADLADYLAAHAPQASTDTREKLLSFLKSLTDERGVQGRLGKPDEVPSSLALD